MIGVQSKVYTVYIIYVSKCYMSPHVFIVFYKIDVAFKITIKSVIYQKNRKMYHKI